MGVFIRLVMEVGEKSTLNKSLGVFHVLKSCFMRSVTAKKCILHHLPDCHKSLGSIRLPLNK